MRRDKSRKSIHFHGYSNTRLYHRWTSIVSRVTDPDNACYKTYGGRGIKICDEWRDYLKFMDWAFKNGYKSDLVIDRIDVNGDYSPKNCRWVTKSESSINRRKKETYCIQKCYRKFKVTIVRKGVHYYFGTFNTINEAIKIRDNALAKYNSGQMFEYKTAISHIL